MADTTKQANDFFKAWGDFKVPAFDFNGAFAIQRRNIEAFSAASQLISEGFQAVSRRQAELAQAGVEDFLATTKEVISSSSPEAGAAKQADFAKKSIQSTLDNVRELTEMFSKPQAEAMDILSKRAAEGMEEWSKAAKKKAA